MASRFNPIDFYRKAGKTLSVAAPQTRRTPVTKVPLSTTGHLFDKFAPVIADYITGERKKKEATETRAEMKDILSAYYNRDGQKARDAVLNAPMDVDEMDTDRLPEAAIASNIPTGIDAVNAMAPSVSPRAQDMRIALMRDAYNQRQAKEERERALAETIDAERRKQANTMALEAYKRENGGSDPTSNMRDFKELQRLQRKYPPDEKGNESPQVKTFRDFVSRTKIMNLGDRFQPYDVRLGQPAATGTPPKVTIQNGQVIRVPGTPGDLVAPPASSSGTPGDLVAPPASSSGAPNTNASGVTTTELPQSRKERDKESGRLKQTRRAGATVIQDLQRGLDIIQNDWSSLSSATAGIAKKLPLTDAKTLDGYIQSALSNVGLDTLQTMRENSPTGGALGQVPVQQQKRLEQVLGSLDIEQRPEIIEDNLKRIINIYKDISYGTPDEIMNLLEQGKITSEIAEGAKDRYELSFDDFGRKRRGNARPALNAAPSEEDILFTMETHGMTREQVLQNLGIR